MHENTKARETGKTEFPIRQEEFLRSEHRTERQHLLGYNARGRSDTATLSGGVPSGGCASCPS